ncbi:MAG: peptidylprolyl isomerase [Planctomycetes bacterium]|nr:peptidylprolyl isomerase [Planctomycetota bacterium]
MRWMLPLLAMVIASAAEPLSPPALIADNAIRYVNEEVITLGDVIERTRERITDLRRRGQPLPESDSMLQVYESVLDELTDESLLMQYALELKVQLDRERIAMIVLERANRSGIGLSLREQTRERERLRRRETMRAVLGFFEDRTARVSPHELSRYYDENREQFRRPARAHVHQILLRPASAQDIEHFHGNEGPFLALFREAQSPEFEPEIAAIVFPRSEARQAAVDAAAKQAEVEAALRALATMPVDKLGARGRRLVADAAALLERAARLRDADATQAALEAIRGEIAGKGLAAFAAAAKKHSEGPRADQGGDLDWIEPGTSRGAAFDQQVFALPAEGLSPVFWQEQVVCLVYVSEREDAAQRSFAEVTGEIDTLLKQRRADEVKRTTVAMLRSEASIRDLVSIAKLLLGEGG